MTEHSALLTAVLDDPDDDTARLVLADMLRESDNPDDQARGRFLWAGVTAHNFLKQGQTNDPLFHSAMAVRAQTVVGCEDKAGLIL
jgi:uncharacterized protein (TIGR02996 family)